jgi:hypothetical protein
MAPVRENCASRFSAFTVALALTDALGGEVEASGTETDTGATKELGPGWGMSWRTSEARTPKAATTSETVTPATMPTMR